VFRLKVYEIPEAPRTSRGRAAINLLDLRPGEQVRAYMPIEDFERGEYFIVFATASGLVKRTALKDYRNVHRSGIIALNLREGDSLVDVAWTDGNNHILLATRRGMAIRFHEDDARAMGRTASGVKGIALKGDDRVVSLMRVEQDDQRDLLTVTANGYGKRTPLGEYLVQPEEGQPHPQSRGGKGRSDIKVNTRNGEVVAALACHSDHDVMLVSRQGKLVRITAASVRQSSRGTQGVKVMNVDAADTVAAVALVAEDGEGGPDGGPAPPEDGGPDADARDTDSQPGDESAGEA
jgi:DNA gyrase subunit A